MYDNLATPANCGQPFTGCDNLICYSQYDGQYYKFPPGSVGMVVGSTPGGRPTWVDASSIAVPDPNGCFVTDTVAGALYQLCEAVKCEAIKDCVGSGVSPIRGLYYNSGLRAFGVSVSGQTGNRLRQLADGLYVSETPFEGVAGPGIQLVAGGTNGHAPRISVQLSSFAGNQLLLLADGAYMKETSFTASAGAGVQIVPGGTNGHAPTISLDLSAFSTGAQGQPGVDSYIGPDNQAHLLPDAVTETSFAAIEGLGIDIAAGGVNGHAPTISLDLSELPAGAAGVAGADSYIGPDNRAHLLPAATPETPFAAVAGQGMVISSGGVNGHAPLLSVDLSTLPTGAQGTLGGVGTANTYIGADNRTHLLPSSFSETTLALVEGLGIDVLPGGTNGHAPTISVNTSEFPAGAPGVAGVDSYLGPDNKIHRLPAVPTFTETSFAAVEGLAIDITAGGTNGHAPTIALDLSELPAGAAGVAGTDSYVGPDNRIHLLPAASTFTETGFAAVEGLAIDITAGGTNGHAPTIAVDTSEFPAGVQGALGGTGAANTYIGADNQAHLLPVAPTFTETSFAAVEGLAIDITAGGTNGHAPTIALDLSELPAGVAGVAGTDSYVGPDNQTHLLPAAPTFTETSFAAVEGLAIDITAGGTNGHAPTIAVDTSEFPAGAQGVAGTDSYIGNDNQAHLLPAALSLTTTSGSKATLATNTLNVPNPLPVASFAMTSKIGLTASFDAGSSSGGQDGNTITYAWTATPVNGTVGAATLATPAAATTTVTFPNEGEWRITLTVTDLNGKTATMSRLISVARYLTVNGAVTEINGSWFGKLQDAYNWINTNDAANDSKYLIEVFGTAGDTATITPNQARTHLKSNALVSVGFNLGAGTYRFSGEQSADPNIQLTSGTAFTMAAGTTLYLSNLAVDNAAGIGIFSTGHVGLYLNNVSITGASCACVLIRGAGVVRIQGSYFVSNSAVGNNPINLFNGCTVEMYDCVVKGGSDSYGVAIDNPGLVGSTVRIKGLHVETPGGTLNSRCPLEVVMLAATNVEISDFTAIARGAPGNTNAYMAIRIRCNTVGGKCVLSNGTILATGSAYGLWVQTPAVVGPGLIIANCDIRSEAGTAISSSTGVSNVVGSTWNPAYLMECSIHGAVAATAGGPITPVAATLSGSNYIY